MTEKITQKRFKAPKVKGHITLELIDPKSGKTVQRVDQDNLVTNAPDIIVNSVAGGYDAAKVMPLAESVLGGLMLFSENLTEDPANIQFPMKQVLAEGDPPVFPQLVGYAGRNTSSDNTKKGYLVTVAGTTGPTANGYQNVWEFNTTQALGVIRAAALTYSLGGSTTVANSGSALAFKGTCGNYTVHPPTNSAAIPLYYDTADQTLYYAAGVTSTTSGGDRTFTIPVYKQYIPVTRYKVADAVAAAGEVQTVTSVTVTLPNYGTSTFFTAGSDGEYVYIISTTPPTDEEETKTRAFRIARLNVADNFSVDYLDKEFALSEGVDLATGFHAVWSDGFIYAATADGKLVRGEATGSATLTPAAPNLGSYTLFNASADYLTPMQGGGLKTVLKDENGTGYFAYIYPDTAASVVVDGGAYTASYLWNLRQIQTPVLMNWHPDTNNVKGNRICGNYLGTIANLGTAITKGSDKVLRVTYTLTDAEGES